jgi:hypothetical protein
MLKLTALLAVASVCAGASAWTLDKVPDIGPWWNPLGPTGTPIYANSFIFSGGVGEETIVTAGLYLRTDGSGPDVQMLLLADGGNAPTSTILSTSVGTVSTLSNTLTLVTAAMSPYAMTAGQRYWLAARSETGDGTYQTGGHTQNSIYADNGTFWYSNANDLNNWDGQGLTPEMAIYVDTVPEPATIAAFALGLGVLVARRRK